VSARRLFLSPFDGGDVGVEFRRFRDLGVDVFTDLPAAAARAFNVPLPPSH
jgi:hypothetical protein